MYFTVEIYSRLYMYSTPLDTFSDLVSKFWSFMRIGRPEIMINQKIEN